MRNLIFKVVMKVTCAVFLVGTPFLQSCRAKPETSQQVEDNSPGMQLRDSIIIFQEEAFYRERPEREEILEGTIEKAEVILGPDSRSMPFYLLTPNRKISIYSTNETSSFFAGLLGKKVKVHGKLIDQSSEGFGWEIWIGTLEEMKD